MAEFGVKATELSGPSSAGAQALAPVQKDAVTFNTSWLQSAGNAIESWIKATPAVDPSRADIEDRYAKRVSEYQQALDQGFLTPSQFAAKRASLFSEITISAGEKWGAGLVYQRLGKLHSATSDGAGVSEADRQAKAMSDAKNKLVTDAVSQGLLPAHMAGDVGSQDTVVSLMQEMSANDERIKRQSAITDAQYKAAAEGRAASKDERERIDYQREENAKNYLMVQGPTTQEAAQTLINSGIEAINKGGDGKLILQDSLNSLNMMEQSMMNSVGFSRDSQSAVKASFDGYRQIIRDSFDPTKMAERDGANQKMRLLAVSKGMMDKDPSLTNIAATAQLLGPNVINTMVSTSLMADFVAARKGQAAPSVLSGDLLTQSDLNKVFNDNMKAFRMGEPVPRERLAQTAEGMNSVFKAVGQVKPEDKVNVMKGLELMASPATASLLSQGAVDPDSWGAAMTTYKSYVQKDMYEKAIQAFAAPIVVPGAGLGEAPREELRFPVASQTKLEANAEGVITVVPNFTHSAFAATPAGQRAAGIRISQMNQMTAGLGMILRIEAHAAGRTDYDKFLEENGSTMFPDIYQSPQDAEMVAKTKYRWIGGPRGLPTSYERVKDGGE